MAFYMLVSCYIKSGKIRPLPLGEGMKFPPPPRISISGAFLPLDINFRNLELNPNENIRCTHEVCKQTYSWGASALLP